MVTLEALQPRLRAWLVRRRGEAVPPLHGGPVLVGLVFLTGIYGGYFGAAQGVILLGLLGVFLPDDLVALNGVKNVLSMVVNLVAALVFLVVEPARIDWAVVGLIALGSVVGGVIGARIGRAMPAWLLRTVIVVIGTIAIVVLLV